MIKDCTMDYIELSELLEWLADLSLDAPDFETALAALKLQSALKNYYFPQ
jgi:hypothetical protein